LEFIVLPAYKSLNICGYNEIGSLFPVIANLIYGKLLKVNPSRDHPVQEEEEWD
jgi:hypothetical protein